MVDYGNIKSFLYVTGIYIVFLLLLTSPTWVPYIINKQSYDAFCESKGYEIATDVNPLIGGCYLINNIECDGEEIFVVDGNRNCKSYDKWGDCELEGKCFFKELR